MGENLEFYLEGGRLEFFSQEENYGLTFTTFFCRIHEFHYSTLDLDDHYWD